MLAFVVALGVMFVANYFVGRFANFDGKYFASLVKPVYAPTPVVFEIGFGAAMCFAVVCSTVSAVKVKLRKSIAVWIGVAGASILWAAMLFVWQSVYGALGISLIIVAALAALLNFYIKNSKELWLAIVPVISWFGYIFAVNYGLCIVN